MRLTQTHIEVNPRGILRKDTKTMTDQQIDQFLEELKKSLAEQGIIGSEND
jgi:ribonuclease HIII